MTAPLLLLPPSETKRDGGEGAPLDPGALSFPELTAKRRQAIAGVRREMRSVAAGLAALRIGPGLRSDVERNRVLYRSPTMPAIERYTGVLYDALDARTLPAPARAWLGEHVVVHSALFGLLRADDPIPAYRLSHDSRLTGLPLRRHWHDAIQAALIAGGRFVIDLRSDSYVELGPAPAGASVLVHVVSEARGAAKGGADGSRPALNHFNKAEKGRLVRALALSGAVPASLHGFVAWGEERGLRLLPTGPDRVDLVVG